MAATIIPFPVKHRQPDPDGYFEHSYKLLKENFGHEETDAYLREKAAEWAQARRDFEASGRAW